MAGVLVFVTVRRAATVPKAVEEPARVPALVAARDIPLHTVISEADVAVREVPPELIPEDGLVDLEEALGQLTTAEIARGEIVLRRRLIAPDYVGPRAAFVMDPARVIVAFPVHDLLGSSDLVRPGDHIEIMFSFDFGKVNPDIWTGMNTFSALSDVEVAAVVRGAGSEQQQAAGKAPATAILLALEPLDALTLKFFRDAGGAPDLALRSPVAEGPFDVPAVDGQYVLERYQIRWRVRQ